MLIVANTAVVIWRLVRSVPKARRSVRKSKRNDRGYVGNLCLRVYRLRKLTLFLSGQRLTMLLLGILEIASNLHRVL